MTAPRTWDIFCAVIDNYGDIGVCWRLARQLAAEYQLTVRLWGDDLASLQRLCPEVLPALDRQTCRGVEIRRWDKLFPAVEPAEAVIEAFACELPANYVAAMAAQSLKPVWINLEYLSAEGWVVGCHGGVSKHPALPLTKHFFFPGFAPGTGGLLREAGLGQGFAAGAWWAGHGFSLPQPDEVRISLFGYENAAVHGLLDTWAASATPITCLLPEGRLLPQVSAWAGPGLLHPGDCITRGNLAVHVLPFLEQDDYDRLLQACDINFVRGEDSFVRAQWAAKPFVWHIYPQQDDAHQPKLEAFLELYCAGLSAPAAGALRGFWRAWNSGVNTGEAWPDWWRQRAELERHARGWKAALAAQQDLAARLVNFCKNKI
ncbi:MAG TPA: elongation factor P maturation arginine rhamnosyltransferase EarP [Novimethylophilus sp.]|jgi:uncharacterized repeat protein (TIGR03837 family)|uniref:elongation factor P maturation arginine rhamnosyltransferase EarP n=1 Tax=Novimethylophilus sp. TaxID=2137426 RepID=UPI002F42ECBD